MLVAIPSSSEAHHAAFSKLFDAYYPRLCLYAFQLVSDKPVAEDLVQDCYLRLWALRDHLELNTVTGAYLYTSVRHAAANYKRDHPLFIAIGDDHALPSSADPLSIAIAVETCHLLHQVIKTLPPRCQEVIRQLVIEGKETREVAETLQCTESTVRNQKAKGIALLRQRLQNFVLSLILF